MVPVTDPATTRRRPKIRRHECPVCDRITVYRLAWPSMHAGPLPPRIFRPHNDPRTGQPCAQLAEQEQWKGIIR